MNIKLIGDAVAPKRATAHSAGYDLHATHDVLIPPSSRFKMPIGVCFEIPNGTVGTISHRSGMNTKQGVWCFGRVDADYQGEVFVTLFNMDINNYVRIKKGDRIAQIVFEQHTVEYFRAVEEFEYKTDRGEGGYGSTGR